jgi:hypothetical protein
MDPRKTKGNICFIENQFTETSMIQRVRVATRRWPCRDFGTLLAPLQLPWSQRRSRTDKVWSMNSLLCPQRAPGSLATVGLARWTHYVSCPKPGVASSRLDFSSMHFLQGGICLACRKYSRFLSCLLASVWSNLRLSQSSIPHFSTKVGLTAFHSMANECEVDSGIKILPMSLAASRHLCI